jgi:hypothetical protein
MRNLTQARSGACPTDSQSSTDPTASQLRTTAIFQSQLEGVKHIPSGLALTRNQNNHLRVNDSCRTITPY